MIISQHNPTNDILRILVNMKQRWSPQDRGRRLVGAINYPNPILRVGMNPTVNVHTLSDIFQNISKIVSHTHIMEYQRDCWEHILTSDEPLIICAPTGFGKTEAFLLPVIDRVITENSLGIIIYPRRELITDQLLRILRMYRNINRVYNTSLRVGIQFEGIRENIKNTLLDNHSRGNATFDRIQDINNLLSRYKGNVKRIPKNLTESRNKIFRMKMIDTCRDEAIIELSRLNKCPICRNGYIRAEVWYNPLPGSMSRGYQLREDFSKITEFKCTNPNCSTVYDLSLSKEDHISKNVHLLITTIESLEILLMDPRFNKWFRDRLRFLVFDEIHVYHSLYGAHVANIVRRFKSIKSNLKLIGISATIDDPQNFGKKFFDVDNVKVISPSNKDKRVLPTKEHYYFIRSRLDATPLSVYIQTAMFLGHSLLPRGKKMIFFFDSRDLVYRATNQLKDAENNQLWRFRIDPNHIHFDNNNCQGFSQNCHRSCPIFLSGECWYAISKILGLQHMPVDQSLHDRIEGVTAVGREYNQDARIINATSVLELGIDDPGIIFVGQYKAPYTVYSFLQRKGRGGRTPNEDVYIFMVLGNDTSDLFYFKRAENIVSQQYILPLEPDNPSIRYFHDLLQLITNKILDCIHSQTSFSRNIVEKCTWEIMLNQILCDNFKAFLASVFGIPLSASNIVSRKQFLCRIVQNAIESRKDEIGRILAKYNVSTTPIQALQDYIQRLTSKSGQFTQDVQQLIDQLIEIFKKLVVSLNQQDRQKTNSLITSIVNLCVQIIPRIPVNHPLYSEITKILTEIPNITTDLSKDEYKVEKLRYEIESLLQLYSSSARESEGALTYVTPNRIVKYLLRSWYFYCKACKMSNQGKCPVHGYKDGVKYPMNICPLLAYFEEPVNLILDISGKTRTITNIDALFNYIPYKTLVEVDSSGSYIVSVRPSINLRSIRVTPTGVYEFDLIPSYLEGRSGIHNNEIVITPEIIHAEKLDLDPQAETLVKFCERCFNYYNFSLNICPLDGTKLRTVRLYVEPIIERRFEIHKGKEVKISNLLSIVELTGYHKLSHLDIEVLKYFWDQNSRRWTPGKKGVSNPIRLRGIYSTPIIFSTTTKGIVLKLPEEFVDKILDDETRNYLAHKSASPEEVLFHTITHVLLLLISSVAGVNPEILWYGWDVESRTIAVWERYEGGTGICETFKEILQKNPARIYEELKRIVECPVHKAEEALAQINLQNPQNPFPQDTLEYVELENLLSENPALKLRIWQELSSIILNSQNIERYNSREIIREVANRLRISEDDVVDHFPTCIDGCPFCIGVPYCTSGKDEQYTNISLKVARKFVEALEYTTRNQDDAAKAILEGGRLVKHDGEEFTILFL